MFPLSRFRTIFGVDFSGAKLAGRNTWIARVENAAGLLRLGSLDSLETLAGEAERDAALGHLVRMIGESRDALWGMDFPFAMPIEVMPRQRTFDEQLAAVARWRQGAYALGVECVNRTKKHHARNGIRRRADESDSVGVGVGNGAAKLHIRRLTDAETKTPFDCYHYRIIYQTYHGMRDVLYPLRASKGVAVLPFDYARVRRARAAVVESCPASLLKRLGWPHNNYKQATGGPLTPRRRRTRRRIVELLADVVDMSGGHVRTIMRNPGADALDAVLAAAGAAMRWEQVDHRAIARHERYWREGYVYA
jgi:hypothetical protein